MFLLRVHSRLFVLLLDFGCGSAAPLPVQDPSSTFSASLLSLRSLCLKSVFVPLCEDFSGASQTPTDRLGADAIIAENAGNG
jgi:hypothetical protein